MLARAAEAEIMPAAVKLFSDPELFPPYKSSQVRLLKQELF